MIRPSRSDFSKFANQLGRDVSVKCGKTQGSVTIYQQEEKRRATLLIVTISWKRKRARICEDWEVTEFIYKDLNEVVNVVRAKLMEIKLSNKDKPRGESGPMWYDEMAFMQAPSPSFSIAAKSRYKS